VVGISQEHILFWNVGLLNPLLDRIRPLKRGVVVLLWVSFCDECWHFFDQVILLAALQHTCEAPNLTSITQQLLALCLAPQVPARQARVADMLQPVSTVSVEHWSLWWGPHRVPA